MVLTVGLYINYPGLRNCGVGLQKTEEEVLRIALIFLTG